MDIDARTGGNRMQFASQINSIPDWCQEIIDKGFIGKDTSDFYEGLLTGYAASLAIIQQLPPEQQKTLIGSIVAHIADCCGWIDSTN